MRLRKYLHDIIVKQLKKLFSLLFKSSFFRLMKQVKTQTDILELKNNLGAHGDSISIQWPIVISEPEKVHLGIHVSIAAFVHIWGGGGVYIGNRVMIGTHTSIASQTHDYTKETMYYTAVKKPIVIEDDVWIGSNCVLMPGIRICRGAVVGAGSVVTHDVEPDTIVAGVPARVLKKRAAFSLPDQSQRDTDNIGVK